MRVHRSPSLPPFAALLLFLLPWLPALVSAETPPARAATGTLVGSVRTSDGLALPQVAVALVGPAGVRRVATGPEGAFRVEGLAAGTYTATVDAPGLVLRLRGERGRRRRRDAASTSSSPPPPCASGCW